MVQIDWNYLDFNCVTPMTEPMIRENRGLSRIVLRRTFGTAATVAGYDLSALQSIMGHSSPVTTGIYQHLAGEYLRDQGRKLNDRIKLEDDVKDAKTVTNN